MNNTEVKTAVEALEPELTAAKLQVALAEATLQSVYARRRVYQQVCDHPDGYKTSCMGDVGFRCPDCKYSR